MITTRLGIGFASILALTAAMPVLAQETQNAQQQGPAFRLRSFRQDVVVDAQGRAETTMNTAIQLLKLSPTAPPGEMPITYNATLQDIEITDAYTQKADGRKLSVDPANILNQHPQSANLVPIFSDLEQKVIIFPNVEAGDTLVYTEKLRDKKTYLPGQYTYTIVPNPVFEVDDARYSISVPKTLVLHADSKDMNQTVTTEGTETVYRWSYTNSAPQARPATLVQRPEAQTHFSVSTLANYDDFAHAYAAAVKDKIAVTPAIQNEADLLTIGIRDPREQARALYDWVSQHVRYVGIELGAGGLIPHDADWTLSNQFGDCKDHAVLFASLLKAKNIPAQMVLINAHPRYTLSVVPEISDFDHMIVWLPSFNLYADTTAGTAAFGTLPSVDSGKPVLHVVSSGPAVHQTPVVAPGELTSIYKVHMNFDEQRRAHVEMTVTGTGAWATDLRRLGSTMATVPPAQAATTILKLHNFPNATGQLTAGPTGGLNSEYSISGNFVTGRLSPQSSVVPLANGLRILGRPGDGPMGPLNNKDLKDSDETPCVSAKQVEDITIEFSSPFHLEQVPKDVAVKTANLNYDSHWLVNGNTVNVHREFESHVSQATALAQIRDDYAAFTRVLPASVQQSGTNSGSGN
jgi:transglutaminase-like putative cysteine protease